MGLSAIAGVALTVALGQTNATEAIQRTVDAAFRAGGGRVTLEAGTYDVSSVRLRSGVELYLKSGAVLRASRTPSDYDGIVVRDAVEPFDARRCAGTDALAVSATNRMGTDHLCGRDKLMFCFCFC